MFDYISIHRCSSQVKCEATIPEIRGLCRLYKPEGRNFTAELGGETIKLSKGRLYVFPCNMTPKPVISENDSVCCGYIEFLSFPEIRADRHLEIDFSRHTLIFKAADILFCLIDKLRKSETVELRNYVPAVESYIANLMFLVSMEYPLRLVSDQRIAHALDSIQQNYSTIKLEDLLKEANLEKNYFIRLFKSSLNITPYQYIRSFRLYRSLSLLRHRLPLMEVAQTVGYSDAVSFSHEFKREFGISPSQFKNSQGQNSAAPLYKKP